ncbi:hypothetical protein HDV02_000992 [Globomyces sp. JEL0801]|nr:hypothetical protein HDV02_000992 [Globomyces sp. JEL0801]
MNEKNATTGMPGALTSAEVLLTDSIATLQIDNQTGKKKKQKPPKPGSKKAQLVKKSPPTNSKSILRESIGTPIIYCVKTVIIVECINTIQLKNCLENVHVFYENNKLNGINFPLSVWFEWLNLNHDSLNFDELYIQRAVEQFSDGVYLIGYIKGDQQTYIHEWAHSHYFISSEFRKMVAELWATLDTKLKSVIERELVMRNYKPEVFEDEFQAYVFESPTDFGNRWKSLLLPIHKQLKSVIDVPKLDESMKLRI